MALITDEFLNYLDYSESNEYYNEEFIDFCTISPNNMYTLLNFLPEENYSESSKKVTLRDKVQERVIKEWQTLLKNKETQDNVLYLFITPEGKNSIDGTALRNLYIRSMSKHEFRDLQIRGIGAQNTISTFSKINKDNMYMSHESKENKFISDSYPGKILVIRCVSDDQREKSHAKELFFLKHKSYNLNNQMSYAMQNILSLEKKVYDLNAIVKNITYPESTIQDLKRRCDWQEIHLRTLEERLNNPLNCTNNPIYSFSNQCDKSITTSKERIIDPSKWTIHRKIKEHQFDYSKDRSNTRNLTPKDFGNYCIERIWTCIFTNLQRFENCNYIMIRYDTDISPLKPHKKGYCDGSIQLTNKNKIHCIISTAGIDVIFPGHNNTMYVHSVVDDYNTKCLLHYGPDDNSIFINTITEFLSSTCKGIFVDQRTYSEMSTVWNINW